MSLELGRAVTAVPKHNRCAKKSARGMMPRLQKNVPPRMVPESGVASWFNNELRDYCCGREGVRPEERKISAQIPELRALRTSHRPRRPNKDGETPARSSGTFFYSSGSAGLWLFEGGDRSQLLQLKKKGRGKLEDKKISS